MGSSRAPHFSPRPLHPGASRQWLTCLLQVKYFKQWRVADIQKKARIAQLEAEGAVRMDVTTELNVGSGGAAPVTSGVPKGTSRENIQEMLAKRKN